MANGDQTHIKSIGSLQITPNIKLSEVLKVPQVRVNLLLVRNMTQRLQCTVTFFPNLCVVQDAATRKAIGLGKQHNGLYYLTRAQNPDLAYSLHKHSNLWHQVLDTHHLTQPSSYKK